MHDDGPEDERELEAREADAAYNAAEDQRIEALMQEALSLADLPLEMKPVSLGSEEQAKGWLEYLVSNGMSWHPEDDPSTVMRDRDSYLFKPDAAAHMRELMQSIYENWPFDPCKVLLEASATAGGLSLHRIEATFQVQHVMDVYASSWDKALEIAAGAAADQFATTSPQGDKAYMWQLQAAGMDEADLVVTQHRDSFVVSDPS